MGPDDSPPPDQSGPVDPYVRALELFDQTERTHTAHLESWALEVARHNDRLRTAGQRFADLLTSLRTSANRDDIDQVLAAWQHVISARV